ncbi:bacteriophage antitermination protein Q [Symbiopectobacterium purcellii]|uniref:bacteriophage antitermination protein Q n=1 Tax=Symbiopectobacterium purcellii TaxID=2871826 RepID=UPI003F8426FB
MNQQYVEYLRGCVSTALADVRQTGRGQLDTFNGAAMVGTTVHTRKRPRLVQLEGRKVCATTDPMHCTETRSRRKPMPPIDPITYSTASWRRALGHLEPHQEAWIRYCYGNDLNYDYQVIICQHVWNEYRETLSGKRTTDRSRRRIESLVWLAVQRYASECGCPKACPDYSDSELAVLSGVTKSTWSENYRHHWQGLIACVSCLDSDALLAVKTRRSESRLAYFAT